jgi:hypothetical protein
MQYNTATGVSIDDTRRIFNFGERVAELAPQQSPFFVYLAKVAKKATNDPVFKFLEQRHQWQRRNFTVSTAVTSADWSDASNVIDANLVLNCGYNKYGMIQSNCAAHFIVPGAVLAIEDDDGSTIHYLKVDDGATIAHSGTDGTNGVTTITAAGVTAISPTDDGDVDIASGNRGQVVGSVFEEGSESPVGWEDKLYDREGYCQIFKTGMNIFSGTSMATEYRGLKNEFQRIWQDKLQEHKMDIEQAFLFGKGAASNETGAVTTIPIRRTWGILPYTQSYGKQYNMSYASSGYDAFLDAMEDFFAPESGNSGNKLVLASRKVITYLNKLGNGSFMNNSVGSSQYRLDVNTIPGAFGHSVTVVNTIFGNLHFVAEPLLRGMWEDYCVCVDMKNVAYRPLVGNGISRDTFIETNVQNPGVDGRSDQVITEAGLEISLPETHAVIKFS